MASKGYPNLKIPFGIFPKEKLGWSPCCIVYPTIPALFYSVQGTQAALRQDWHLVGPVDSVKIPDKELKDVSPELEAWIEASDVPVVYAAFGTLSTFNKEQV